MVVYSAFVLFKGKVSSPRTATLGRNVLPHNGIAMGFDALGVDQATKIVIRCNGVAGCSMINKPF
jgi:hypothetical protein